MLPVRVFSIASPPPGTLFAISTAAAEATTYTIPMNASCGTRCASRCEVRVKAKSSAPTASELVGRGAAAAEGAGQLRDPQVHEVEVAVNAGRAVRVGRNDHRLRASLVRHLEHLVVVVVIRGQEHLDVSLAHLVDDFEDVPRRRRAPCLGLDVVDARVSVLP